MFIVHFHTVSINLTIVTRTFLCKKLKNKMSNSSSESSGSTSDESVERSSVDLKIIDWNSDQSKPFELTEEEVKNIEEICLEEAYEVTRLPEDIFKLTNITTMSLDNCQLSCIPDSISKLVDLKRLYCCSNALVDLPLGLKSCIRLKELCIDENSIVELPDIFGQMRNLCLVEAQGNKLVSIPDSLLSRQKLRVLDLTGNNLTALGELKSTQLTELFLDDNKLDGTKMEWLGNMDNLTKLEISSNKLTTLPSSMTKIKTLKLLNVSNNRKLTALPQGLKVKRVKKSGTGIRNR